MLKRWITLTSREATRSSGRRKDDVKEPPPLLQDPLRDSMRRRVGTRVFVEEVTKLGDFALDRFFYSRLTFNLAARIDPVRPMTGDVPPYLVLLPVSAGERERARLGEEIITKAGVRNAKLQRGDEKLDG